MIGKFKILSFESSVMVKACSCMNEAVEGLFYLPPLSRKTTSDITENDLFFGVLDEVSGYGALIVAFDDADFKGRFDYDLHCTESIKIDKNADIDGNASIDGDTSIKGVTTCDSTIKAKTDILFGAGQNSIMTHKHTATDTSIPGLTANPQTLRVSGSTDGGYFA